MRPSFHMAQLGRRRRRAAWCSSAAAIALTAGCQSAPAPEASQGHPAPVSVYPISPPPEPEVTAAKTPIQPVQAVEPPRMASPQAQSPPLAPAPATTGAVPLATTLDLGTALKLAGVENPTINLAAERIREALGLQLEARVLLLPNLNIGGNYHYNNGPVQSSYGQIIPVNDQALYMGFGAGTLGAMSVANPGIWLYAQLGNAIFEPQAARQNVVAKRANSAAVQIAILGDVATAYLRLVGAEARLAELVRSDQEGHTMTKITTDFAEAGQGRPADMNRAKSFDDLVLRQRIAAEGDVDIASAQLCRLLNLDPSSRLRTAGGAIEPFRLIPEETEEEVLIARALQMRPELVNRTAAIREAQIRVRQERTRPLLPTVSVGLSAGAFGGESNLATGSWTSMTGRTDFDAMLVWNLQNLGFGNRARVKAATAVVGESLADYESTRNLIRTEVMDALAAARGAARQMTYARAALDAAIEAFQLDLDRIRNGGGIGLNAAKPIELLYSFSEVLDARLALVDTITAYDVAQFRLFVAVGSNPLAGPDVSLAVPMAVPNGPGMTK